MIVRKPTETGGGLAPIIGIEGAHPRMLMDVATLRLAAGDSHSNDADRERAFLLLRGEVDFLWSGGRRRATRESYLEEEPWVLHVPARAEVKVVATEGEAELVVQGVRNDRSFPVRLYGPGECRSEEFGAGTMQETSTRLVRTIFDAATAPHSQMVLGEVVNHPGKWSSYPPHHHPQPEVYHYRFSPPGGFGLCVQGEESYVVRDGDTALIEPGVVHPQVAAPGYAMYYVWMIPHLPAARFWPDSREFLVDYRWVMDPEASIWPDGESSYEN